MVHAHLFSFGGPVFLHVGRSENEENVGPFWVQSENSPGLWPNGVLDNKQLNPYQSLAFLAT